MRACGHDGWQEGCPDCEREHALALAAMGDVEPRLVHTTVWRVTSFDPAVPIVSLRLVLNARHEDAEQLVEQAARAWGVEIEREHVEHRIVFASDVDALLRER